MISTRNVSQYGIKFIKRVNVVRASCSCIGSKKTRLDFLRLKFTHLQDQVGDSEGH